MSRYGTRTSVFGGFGKNWRVAAIALAFRIVGDLEFSGSPEADRKTRCCLHFLATRKSIANISGNSMLCAREVLSTSILRFLRRRLSERPPFSRYIQKQRMAT